MTGEGKEGIHLRYITAKRNPLPRKTIYGKCPKCRTKSELEVRSGNPGKEKFRCNQCYHEFGMNELQ